MNEFIQMCLEMVLQASPIVAVLAVLGYIAKAQKRRGEKREKEKKKGIIRKKYVVKTEKIMTIIFVLGIFFSGGCAIASALAEEIWVPIVFGIAFIGFLLGSLNMIMWKLEINDDEITWRSTFGKKEPSILGILHTAKERRVPCVFTLMEKSCLPLTVTLIKRDLWKMWSGEEYQ